MDAIERTLRERLHRAGAEMIERPLHAVGTVERRRAPQRNLRPLLAAVALAVVVGGVAGGVGLHGRLGSRQSSPATSPPAVPTLPVGSTATPVPSPTWQAAPFISMYSSPISAWDSTHKQLVTYVGASPKTDIPAAIWTWQDGWHQQHAATAAAPGMFVYARVFADIPALHGVALLGGDADKVGADAVGGNWLWDGTAWTLLPNAGMDHCMQPTSAAWDQHRNHLVVIASNMCSGGNNPAPPQTWTFDGRSWQRRAAPPSGSVVAWDPEVNAVVMIGAVGGKATAWTWTGTGWSRGTTSSPALPPDARVAAWDARIGALVVYAAAQYDGSSPARVLAYAKGKFTEMPQSGYPEGTEAVFADTTHGRLLAIGQEPIPAQATPAGYDSNKDYYVLAWNGSTWVHITWTELNATP